MICPLHNTPNLRNLNLMKLDIPHKLRFKQLQKLQKRNSLLYRKICNSIYTGVSLFQCITAGVFHTGHQM